MVIIELMKAHWPISILSTLSSLISMALPLILVRELDPSTLGSFKIFFLYLMVLPPLTFIAGVSSGLSYWAGRGEEGIKAIRVSAILFLIISCVSLAVMLAVKMPLSQHLHVGADWVSLFAYALFFGIASLFYDDAAIATGRIWTGALFNSGFELFRTGAIVLTAVYTHDLFSIIKAHIFIQMIKTITGYALAYRQDLFRFEWDKTAFKGVAKYAFPVSLAFVFGLWLNYSDQIILSKTITAAEFALYTVCCLTVPPLLVLEASVTRVLIPQLSESFAMNESKGATRLYRKAVNELSFLVIPAVFGMFIFAAPIIQLLFTKTYVSGAPYLRLYSLWYLTLLIPQDAVARAQGKARWILVNFIFFASFTLALCFGFGHFYGAFGVLSGLLIARFISRAYTAVWMRQTLSWRIRDFIPFRSMSKMTGLCLGLGLICFAMQPLFSSSMNWFFVCGGSFAVLYLGFGFSLLSEGRSNSPKVLMLTPGLFIGGLERMILNLSKSLKSTSQWQPSVLAYDFAPVQGAGSDLIQAFESFAIPVHSKVKPSRFSIKTAAQIAGMVSREGVTVIHTHDLGALIYGAIAKLFLFSRVKLVHTQHSFVHLNRSWKYRYYERFFTLFANSIAVVSEDTEQSYKLLGVPTNKLHVIPNGVDFPAAPDLDRRIRILSRQELLAKLPARSRVRLNDYWILYLARIHGRKGQDHAIALWNNLAPEIRQNCSLLLVGPETETGEWARIENLIKNAKDSERIVLAGPTLAPQEWLKAADVYLSCSEFEGMPLSPIEAIGSGIPALLSKIPGHEFLEPFAQSFELEKPLIGAELLTEMIGRISKDDNLYRRELWDRTEALRAGYTLATMSGHYEKLYGPKS
jgi:glycosyltransferase involved in cell wall biosynthesis/O-antigen/teichoic acid export membrane protein